MKERRLSLRGGVGFWRGFERIEDPLMKKFQETESEKPNSYLASPRFSGNQAFLKVPNLLTSLLKIIKYQELKLHHFMRKGAESHEGDKEVIAGE